MCDQVCEHVRRASIEKLIFLAVFHALDRALELQLEVAERRYLRKLVPFFFKEIIGLIHHHVIRKSPAQLLKQRRLSGSMGS